MNTDPKELISAFLDGEVVPPDNLSQALSLPDAREMLVDFVILRAGFRADQSQPDDHFQQRMERALVSPRSSIGRFFAPLPMVTAVGMAAVFFLVVWFGGIGPEVTVSIKPEPPSVDRVLQFERGVDWQGMG